MRVLVFLVSIVLLVLFAPAPGFAQTQKQREATQAFKNCREMEEYGDATACWQRWLEKHKASGHEAEIMVAEERVSKGSPKSAPKPTPPKEEPKPTAPKEEPTPAKEKEEKEEKKAEAEEEPAEDAEDEDDVSEEDEPEDKKVEEPPPDDPSDDPEPYRRPSRKDQLGLSVQVHGMTALHWGAQFHYMDVYDPATPGQALEFKIPSLVFGGGLAVRYDLSDLLRFPEAGVRLGGDLLIGNGTATQALIISSELLYEQGFRITDKLVIYAGLGPTFSMLDLQALPRLPTVRLTPTDSIPGDKVTMKARRFGAIGLAGLEWEILPLLSIRAEALYRLHLSKKTYYASDPVTGECLVPGNPAAGVPDSVQECDGRAVWQFDRRRDSFDAVGGRVGVLFAF